ncbi:MAG: nucleotidyltransferase domain-containing protein [Myxococcales bacterium]|nr:nucleotidyltransferase domain-containing protein [Myxococcales bacterium]
MSQPQWPDFPAIPASVKGALVALRERMRARFGERFIEARLFGSYARGEQHHESDVDVALLFADELSLEERDAVFDDVAAIDIEFKLWVSPKIFSRTELERMREDELQLALDIEEEGIRL